MGIFSKPPYKKFLDDIDQGKEYFFQERLGIYRIHQSGVSGEVGQLYASDEPELHIRTDHPGSVKLKSLAEAHGIKVIEIE